MGLIDTIHAVAGIVRDARKSLRCSQPASNTVPVRREWLEHVIKCLSGPLPSGQIGDNVFLLRDQLRSILDRPSQPETSKLSDAEYVKLANAQLARCMDENQTLLAQVEHWKKAYEEARDLAKLAITSTVLPSAEGER
jgi:hypothetical protein